MTTSAFAGSPSQATNRSGVNLALWFAAVHAMLIPSLHTLALIRVGPLKVGEPIWVAYLYGSYLILPALFMLALFTAREPILAKLDKFELFLGALVVWGVLLTVYYGGDGLDILGKLLRFVLIFACYKVGRQLMDPGLADRFLNRTAKFAAWGVGLAVVIVYGLGVFGPFRAVVSIYSEYLLATLAVLAMSTLPRKWLFVGLATALLILSGKRGNLVAAAIMLVYGVIYGLRMGTLQFERIRKPLAAGGLAFVALFVGFTSDQAARVIEDLPLAIRSRLDVFVTDSSAVEVTANRSLEVDLALRQLGYEPLGMITGLGLGASLPGVIGRTADTIHIQPLFMLFMLGIFGIALYVWACVGSVRPIWQPRIPWNRTDATMSLFAVGIMGTTLTSATFLNTPLLWIAIGYLTQRASSRGAEARA